MTRANVTGCHTSHCSQALDPFQWSCCHSVSRNFSVCDPRGRESSSSGTLLTLFESVAHFCIVLQSIGVTATVTTTQTELVIGYVLGPGSIHCHPQRNFCAIRFISSTNRTKFSFSRRSVRGACKLQVPSWQHPRLLHPSYSHNGLQKSNLLNWSWSEFCTVPRTKKWQVRSLC